MPLGASITYGEPSDPASLGRGYRKYIRDSLRFRGWNVNMVGSRNHGQFADNDVEGWPGLIIDNITEKARAAVPKYKPNLILINAGTNDATGNVDIENTGERMRTLVQTCFDLSPGVVIVLSTLLPNTHAPDNVLEINRLYRDLVIELQDAGQKIQLADMNDGFITLDHILSCGTHPTIEGQRRMAAVWGLAIQEIEERGDWFQAPSSNVYNSGAQDPRNGMQVLRGGSPSRGGIWSDNLYSGSPGVDGGIGVYAAQAVNVGGADRGGEDVSAYLNHGDGAFYHYTAKVDGNCIIRGIRWGDVNNDGLDDFICIDPSGNMFVSINEGTNPPSWRDVGKFKNAVSGYGQDRVRLGDIDGDGRLDYCVINDDGSLHCWRNGGILFDSAKYWQDMGIVFKTSETLPDIAMMRFVDINGDFRSDILWVDGSGKVRTWINQRGNGKSLVPYWRDAGVTHGGMHEDVKGQQNIIFGRIYSRRPSYLYRQDDYDPATTFSISTKAWENLGSGGTTQKGDGAHWGDMTGTGNDDYVWIGADGKVVIFPNVNTPPNTTGYPNWGVAQTLETGLDRKALHVGDWNNDGKADIIGVNKDTGSLTVWLTTYSNGVFSFRKVTNGNTLYCTEGWGVGLFDLGHHFADITGSGCVDYLCMQPDGRTTAWLNDCKADLFALRSVGQVKFSEDLDRANHRFADVDGDGLADFLWVDKFTGDASVWINKGEQPEDQRGELLGSKFKWEKSGPLYAGSNRGANLHYPNLGGQGRADQVDIDPNTAKGYASFNTCPPGGDDGGIVPRDPSLPGYEPQPQCSVNICRLDGTGYDGYAGADPCGPDPFADAGDDDDDDGDDDGEEEKEDSPDAESTLKFNSTALYWKNATRNPCAKQEK
ncbi:carbohydrate esterase family 3 protein [Xylaria arbuscula]|nr:carbohydrate esterase family 3 protein [Xylaria arbuscula]